MIKISAACRQQSKEPQATRRPRLGKSSKAQARGTARFARRARSNVTKPLRVSGTRGARRLLHAVERSRLPPKAGAGKRDSLLICVIVTGLVMLQSLVAVAEQPRPGTFVPEPGPYTMRVERSHFIPMRDGVRLSTDFYLPAGYPGSMATVLLRTPYNKSEADPLSDGRHAKIAGPFIRLLVSHGFAVLVQDTRGKYESEGEYILNKNYRVDAYDTIEWIAGQGWSNGKVGTYGCSYLGENQMYMAPSQPPALAAMIPQAGSTSIGQAGGFYGLAHDFSAGAIHLAGILQWHFYNLHKLYYRPPPGLSREEFLAVRGFYNPAPNLPEVDWDALFWTLPVIDMLDRAGGPKTDFRDFVTHQYDVTDSWWEQFDYVRDDEPISVPSLYIETWGDFTARPTFYLRNMHARTAVNEIARNNQKVIMAPGSHCTSEMLTDDMRAGEVDLGDPRFGHLSIYLDWYRQWLRGESRGVEDWPEIQYYMIGRNEWRASAQWPPADVKMTSFYFHSGGSANSHDGDGSLSRHPPGEEAADQFTYDPATPVISAGGPYSSGVGSAPYMDQRPTTSRHDVLVYTSDVLKAGLEIEGPINAILQVSSSAPDTDFSVKLVDVAPDGNAVNIRVGYMRARYREGREQQVLMQTGGIYEVPVSLNDIAWWFKPGHRIRVQVTSSDFPSYARNLNTGGRNFDETEWQVAHNTVHHSGAHASRIILPVSSSK